MNIRQIGVALLLVLSACSSSQERVYEAQQWGDFSIHFQTRPEVLHPGMNEFLVLVDRQGKRHIPDLLVKIRINDDGLQQAMPDGALGVYRRALYVHDEKKDQLHVLLSYHGQQGELVFPLTPDAKNVTAH